MNTIKIVDVSTDEVVEREMNQQEYDDVINRKEILATEIVEAEAKEAARQALLDKLGITEDEAKLLLG